MTRETEQTQHIVEDLLTSGVRPGGVLLVHSSLSAMGEVTDGPEAVVQGLLQVLGPEGTLLMPALSYERVTYQRPVFDVRRTPANVGAIPEHFRTRPGTRRSVHPTHSVCGTGPLAETLLRDHILDNTPCGIHSPFRRLRDQGGQILMLGCGLRPNTSMHAIEEMAEPPYLFGGLLTYQITLADGGTYHKTYRTHGFAGWRQRYDRAAEVLDQDRLRRGRVLEAEVYLIEAQALWEAALAALRRNPLYFVDKIEG